MKPILFSPTETAFSTNGIGILSDAISCRVIQELNGQYELEMKYPITGMHFTSIQQRSLIQSKVDPTSELQPFRVYQITKPSSGVVTVRARHIAYDLGGIPVSPFTASGVGSALNGLPAKAVVDCPFTFFTDKSAPAAFSVAAPAAIWSLLGGSAGGILDTYGGEYEFDKYLVRLWNRRGADRGVSIRYGKNLTSLEQDENCANCYTGVYPYWIKADGQLVQLPEKIVNAPGTYNYVKILPLDLSADWQEAPTEDQLRARAERYIVDNDIGRPVVSWKVEFVQLEQTEEYKGKALLERVLLGDTVSVEFEQIGVSATPRAVAVDYDSILERYNSVTLGRVKANIADTIAEQNKEISTRPNKSEMQIAIEQLTSTILGAMGGAVRFLDTNGDGAPDTLYIADNADPAQATKVWRFNYEGWGASENGYNGPFKMGATLDKGFLAEFIKAGVLSSADGKVRIDLSGGTEPIFNSGISTNGLTVRGDVAGTPDLFSVRAKTQEGIDDPYAEMYLKSANGQTVARLVESFTSDYKDPIGVTLQLIGQDKKTEIQVYANRNETGVLMFDNGEQKAGFITNVDNALGTAISYIKGVDSINPGKKQLWSGTCAVGSACAVKNTAYYDLFAVRLGDSSNTFATVVLAYRVGNTIRGVGGWCGTATEQKQIFFLSATFSGDTWTIVDAGVHNVSMAGGVSVGTRLQVKEVIGVI